MLVVDAAASVMVIGGPYGAGIGADATDSSPSELAPPPPPSASTYAFVVASSASVGAPTLSRPLVVR
ncbi:hypothetical protein CEJ39_21770 [Rhodococcus pyridinivorans]|nr:hypothetical protein CEJ39_21770 [Rhodococcus pyridinivorans]